MRSKFTPKAEAHESNVDTNNDASRQWYWALKADDGIAALKADDGSPVFTTAKDAQAVRTGPPTEVRRCTYHAYHTCYA